MWFGLAVGGGSCLRVNGPPPYYVLLAMCYADVACYLRMDATPFIANGVNTDMYASLGSEDQHRTSWPRISAIIVASMLGTGVLSLPYAASVLGWLPFILANLVFCTGALYSGSLYARLFQHHPSSKVQTTLF